MTIKAFAFEVQSSLSKAHGIALKRSHVHEVLAALFGFASYAALTAQRVLAQHDGSVPTLRLDLSKGASRAMELGHAPPEPPLVAAVTASAAEAARLYVVPLEAVLYELGIEFSDTRHLASADDGLDLVGAEASDFEETDDDGVFFALDSSSHFLRESLVRMADGGNALAHLALAQLDDELLTDLSDEVGDGSYWFEQQQSGRPLAGVEFEWAAGYRRKQEALSSRQEHFRRAIALGNAEAALRQLEIAPTDENFEQAANLAGVPQAARLVRIASFLGREDDARRWLRVLALQGDTTAMKELADGLETGLKEAWTWVHLAKLLGVDVMAYHAVGDDGLPADADEAGPVYAAGGFHLERLPDRENAEALEAARQILAKLAPKS